MRPKPLLRRALLVGAVLLGCGCSREERAQHAASYVGSEACAGCHQQEHDGWALSHHALAMQPVSPTAALGDFADRTFVHGGTESRFFRRDGGWYCRTDGEDGAMAEFAVRCVADGHGGLSTGCRRRGRIRYRASAHHP